MKIITTIKPLLFIYCFIISINLRSQHLPVNYFDGNFELKSEDNARYYGTTLAHSKQHYIVTLYSPKSVKVATLSYLNKELTKKHGSITGYFINGDTQFVSNYSKNNLEGIWQSWYPNRRLCDSGRLKGNMPDGVWKSWYPDGTLRMVAEFDSKKLMALKEEMLRMYRPFIRTFRGGQLPPGTPGAVIYHKHQYEKMLDATRPGDIIGNAAGYSLTSRVDYNTQSEAGKYLPPFDECLVDGVYISFFPDGSLKDSGYCNNGLRAGVWEEWASNVGLRSVGFYKKGIKQGEWRYYNKQKKFLYLRRFNRSGYEKQKIEAG